MKNKGFENVQFMGKKGMEEPTLLDGLKLLLENKECNLGWRIIAKNLLKDTDFKTLLKETDKDDAKRFSDLIKADEKREVKKMLKTLRVVRDRKQMEDEDETKDENETEDKDKTDLAELLKKVGIDAYGIATDYLKDEIKFCKPNSNRPYLSIPEIRNIPITATTIERSKGLAADYVFITYFDDQYFIKDKSQVSDQDICKFIVALTRTRKKAFLISSDAKKRPVFLKWIDEKRILVDEGDG
jgi:superfamily I DNA/RNA helicase